MGVVGGPRDLPAHNNADTSRPLPRPCPPSHTRRTSAKSRRLASPTGLLLRSQRQGARLLSSLSDILAGAAARKRRLRRMPAELRTIRKDQVGLLEVLMGRRRAGRAGGTRVVAFFLQIAKRGLRGSAGSWRALGLAQVGATVYRDAPRNANGGDGRRGRGEKGRCAPGARPSPAPSLTRTASSGRPTPPSLVQPRTNAYSAHQGPRTPGGARRKEYCIHGCKGGGARASPPR